MNDETKKFIEKAVKKHGNKYDYSQVNYINSTTKITIICNIHDKYIQTPTQHLRPSGCKQCHLKERGLKGRSSTKEFIEKAKKLHGDKYYYSLVEYTTSQKKVMIICPDHGMFEQTPNTHLRPSKCSECARKDCSNTLKDTTKGFIEKARELHGDKYYYSKVKYMNYKTEITIICKIHGDFLQTPDNHLHTSGCIKCTYNDAHNRSKSNKEEFIKKAKKVHGDKYDYSLVDYHNARTKVIIICPKHGQFKQMPYNHLVGQNCPDCGKEIACEKNKKRLIKKTIDNPNRSAMKEFIRK